MASTLEVVGIVTAFGVVATGALYVGGLRSDVDGLEARVAKLEARPLTAGKINRGDICYKLMDELSKDGSIGRRSAIEQQIADFDCYKAVSASTAIANELSNELSERP